ncbi:S41 family peptidase [Sphingomonas antarctica]|uniref:S41 family peptidase n=1 Tax=Sphingomonas antarctica TaxID=2040274 RepID=UPI0039E966A4
MKNALRLALATSAAAMIPILTGAMGSVDPSTAKELDTFMEVFDRVRADYVDKVDDKVLIRGAVDGMLAALDPHSGYEAGTDYANLRAQTDGEYGGLGLTVTMEDGAVKVITPAEDTPGARAGIKSGDYITHLNGQFIVGGTLDEAVDQMRGKPGTTIMLTLVRPGRDKPFDVTLTREIIKLRPVKWEVKGDVGYININAFSRDTGGAVRAALMGVDKALGHQPAGYVVDLRENPGGLLDEAVAVSDAFLDKGNIVSQRGRDPRQNESWDAAPGDFAHGLPVVVLVDAGSASAAEIVAGALRDNRRAIVMGERSFGKGSVQTVAPLSENTALRLTTARYYTPSGKSIQEGGIEPDIIVPQLTDPDYKDRPRIREADLRKHLLNQAKVDNSVLESDAKADPRFAATPEQLKAKGIDDFQLDYALKTVARLATTTPTRVAARK